MNLASNAVQSEKNNQELFDIGNLNKSDLTPELWLEQIKCLHSVFFLNKKL